MKKVSVFLPLVAALFGIMLSVGAVFSAYQYLISQAQTQFVATSHHIQDQIQGRIFAAQTALDGLEAVTYASREMTADKLNIVAQQQMSETSVVDTMFYAQLVRHEERAAFESMQQDEGYITFAIKQNATTPASEQSLYLPITFIEPFKVDNVWLIGFDLLSIIYVREHASNAIKTGEKELVHTNFYRDQGETSDLWIFKALYAGQSRFIRDDKRASHANGMIGMRLPLVNIFKGVMVPANTSMDVSLIDHTGEIIPLKQLSITPKNVFLSFDLRHEIRFGEHVIILKLSQSLLWTNSIFFMLLVGLLVGLFVTAALVVAVRALLISEERQRAILASSLDGIITMNEDGLVQAFNPAAEKIFGYVAKDVIDKNISGLIVPQGQKAGVADYNLTIGDSRTLGIMREITAVRANGEEFPAELTLTEVSLTKHRLFTAFVKDVAKRKHAEGRVNQLATVVEQAELAIIVTDCDGVIQYVNPMFETLSGYSNDEAVGKQPNIVKSGEHPPEYYNDMWQALKEGKSWIGEFINQSKTGDKYEVMQTVFPIFDPTSKRITGFASIQRDITESKRHEQQAAHLQRLESLGVMAGGIAHDFNNLLAAIMGNASLALNKVTDASAVRRHLVNINKASDNAALLCKQMLAYSGQGQFTLASININTMILDITQLLNTSISKKATLEIVLQEDIAPIHGDPGQIQQIIMNLVINASEALGDDVGDISISTKNIVLSHDDLKDLMGYDDMVIGEYVVLTIRDHGCGMSSETQQKMFEPFFTTKFTGRGLGMSAILGIIRSHHGGIICSSNVGKGTEFKVFLPMHEEPEVGMTTLTNGILQEDIDLSKYILIVDDEEMIREMCVSMLEEKGFSILVACDGEEAVATFQKQHKNISLVILDMTMPKMSGAETYQHLVKISPQVRVMISSGYTEKDIGKQFEDNHVFGFLQKPYSQHQLLKKVAQALVKQREESPTETSAP